MIENRHGITEPLVALTFDDRPSVWSEPILDRLAEHDGRATFFVLGNVIENDAAHRTLRRMVSQGSEIGNHTYSHRDLQRLCDPDISKELGRTSALIEEITSVAPLFWRAPYFRSGPRIRSLATALGLREVRWSIDPSDWRQPPELTVQLVLDHLQPGDIVDLHDGRPAGEPGGLSLPTREATVQALDQILLEMTNRGLRSVTITELLAAS